MKGVVFNLLEEVVTAEYGPETWDMLIEASQSSGVYTSLGTYPDDELFAFVGAASEALGIDPQDVIRWFGRKALPLMAERYPVFFDGHRSTHTFILTLNNIIHPEVRKVYPGADVPEFGFAVLDKNEILMTYASKRKLCSFAKGLIEGSADFFGEAVEFTESSCMNHGDPSCEIHISIKVNELQLAS